MRVIRNMFIPSVFCRELTAITENGEFLIYKDYKQCNTYQKIYKLKNHHCINLISLPIH